MPRSKENDRLAKRAMRNDKLAFDAATTRAKEAEKMRRWRARKKMERLNRLNFKSVIVEW